MKTDRKSYAQVCPVATALDIIGDRWTILILRELLGGPARFNEIRDGLPGIAGNLLAERLRRLEEDGLVRQSNAAYSLTKLGASTRIIVEELGMWGTRAARLVPPEHQRSIRAVAVALQSIFVRAGDKLPSGRIVIELDIEGDIAEVVLDQNPSVIVRAAAEPDAYIQTTTEGMSTMLRGHALDGSAFTATSGDEKAIKYFLAAMR